MIKFVDDFHETLHSLYKQLMLSISYIELGNKVILQSDLNASVQIQLDEGIYTEPTHLRDVIGLSGSVHLFTFELFQNKLISKFYDLIDDIYESLVNKHFSGERPLKDVSSASIKINFKSGLDFNEQIKNSLVKDFKFKKFSDRLKTINKELDCVIDVEPYLFEVKKHVLIRNAIQHHDSVIYDDMLKELGVGKITLIDSQAKRIDCKIGGEVMLSASEFDLLKRNLFMLTQNWRRKL